MKSMSKQCDIVRDILPLYVDGACSEASAEMVKEHLNACADCNAIYQKLLSHTSEDVLHEESESVIMRHEAKEKQRGRKKITIAVLVSIALCIIAIFTALFLLPIFRSWSMPENGQKQKRRKHLRVTMKSSHLF